MENKKKTKAPTLSPIHSVMSKKATKSIGGEGEQPSAPSVLAPTFLVLNLEATESVGADDDDGQRWILPNNN